MDVVPYDRIMVNKIHSQKIAVLCYHVPIVSTVLLSAQDRYKKKLGYYKTTMQLYFYYFHRQLRYTH